MKMSWLSLDDKEDMEDMEEKQDEEENYRCR